MGEKNDNGGKGKSGKEKQTLTVVLKVDLHCEGCTDRIVKFLNRFEGVQKVETESSTNKVTVVGAVDPPVLREKLNLEMKRQVDLISPQPKKNNPEKVKKPENKKKPDDDKKKETPATKVVLKLQLHCQGCIAKIRKTVSKTKGFHEMSIDEQKDLVTVKGTMDVKALTGALEEKLKRSVQIVPPKEEEVDGNDGRGGGKNKNKGNGGGGEDRGKEDAENNGCVRLLEHIGQPDFRYWYPYAPGPGFPAYALGPGFLAYAPGPVCPVLLHAPQIFSDENPNACSIL